MFATLVKATLVSLFAVQGVLAEFRMDTPAELVQCQPVRLIWEKTKAPYDMAVVPGNNPCGDVIRDLGDDHNGTSMTWMVNVKAGTSVLFSLLDGDEDDAWTGAVTVKESDDDSCLPESERTTTTSSTTSSTSSTPSPVVNTNTRTTLLVTNTPAAPVPTNTPSGGATPVGAANAGGIPGFSDNGSSSVRLPGAVTAFGAVAAVLAVMTL